MTKQAPHPLTMIPGPIEFTDEVLDAMSTPSQAHTSPQFIATFQSALKQLRELFISSDPAAQPYVIAGSGTLGWDIAATNFINPGDDVLVLVTGYFGDSFADCLGIYGANVTKLEAEVGSEVPLDKIRAELGRKKYRAVTVTHVDTSTGVLANIEAVSKLVKSESPETLVIVDGVCSVGVEEIRFDEWGLDFVLTASQKAIGVPAGLSISFASGRAVAAALEREKSSSYFANLKKWTPIMKNYEAGKPSYFATPAVQSVTALDTSLKQILSTPLSERFSAHKAASDSFKSRIESLGLKLVSQRDVSANGLSAIFLPEGVENSQLLPLVAKKNIVLAGGLHKAFPTRYFRVGHMGVSVTDSNRTDLDQTYEAIASSLAELGYKK